MRYAIILSALALAGVLSSDVHAAPLAEQSMLEGRLTEGEKELRDHLQASPKDDQARFGLGVIQFLLTFEHLGTSLYEHGLRTERAFPGMAREVRDVLPQNPEPKAISYADFRRIIQTAVDDLNKAEATLAAIEGDGVKLPLHVALIKIDPFGLGKPVNAAFILGELEANLPNDRVNSFVIGFDRGDVNWLRGYCHLLCAVGEILLAVDGREMFDRTAHLFFEKVDTPHKFLLEEDRNFERVARWNAPLISDVIAFIHLTRFPIKEPKRMEAAHAHLNGTVSNAKEMWKHYHAEMDNDLEWIPNPRQKGVMQVGVSQQMVDTWLETVDEADQVLAGKKLIPFWRGDNPRRGVNLKRVFFEPRAIDPILWVQGTAATPYLDEGQITDLADARTLRQISETFGGLSFFGFAIWFN